MKQSSYRERDHVEIVFLGSRGRDLARRLIRLADLEDMPPWLTEAAAWARRAKRAEEKRDELMHRPAAVLITEGGLVPALQPARAAQAVEALEGQALRL